MFIPLLFMLCSLHGYIFCIELKKITRSSIDRGPWKRYRFFDKQCGKIVAIYFGAGTVSWTEQGLKWFDLP